MYFRAIHAARQPGLGLHCEQRGQVGERHVDPLAPQGLVHDLPQRMVEALEQIGDCLLGRPAFQARLKIS